MWDMRQVSWRVQILILKNPLSTPWLNGCLEFTPLMLFAWELCFLDDFTGSFDGVDEYYRCF